MLDRIISLTEENHGSDWVAHGLLDSIVDAFFPLIRYVDTEVDEIDSLSIDPTTDPRRHTQSSPESPPVSTAVDPKEAGESSEKNVLDEKPIAPRFEPVRPPPSPKPSWRRWARAHLPAVPSGLIYIRLFFLPTSSAAKRKHEEQPKQIYDRSTMLKRITDTRRLVTGLSRLLGAKHQVIGRLRKRGAEIGEGVEAYIGDLEGDFVHILMLSELRGSYRSRTAAANELVPLRIHPPKLPTRLSLPPQRLLLLRPKWDGPSYPCAIYRDHLRPGHAIRHRYAHIPIFLSSHLTTTSRVVVNECTWSTQRCSRRCEASRSKRIDCAIQLLCRGLRLHLPGSMRYAVYHSVLAMGREGEVGGEERYAGATCVGRVLGLGMTYPAFSVTIASLA